MTTRPPTAPGDPGPADPPAPSLGPIVQVLVPVADVDRAVEFYGGVLGLPLLFRFPGNAFFDLGAGVRLYLGVPTEPGFSGAATLYLRAGGIEAAVDAIRRRGGRIRQRPHVAHRDPAYDLWLAFVDDPDGNHIGLMEERPPAGGTEAGRAGSRG